VVDVVRVMIFDLHTGALTSDFVGLAPSDASTALLSVLATSIVVTPAHPRFTYTVKAFDLLGTASEAFTTTAGFNAFTHAVSNALFATVPPGSSFLVPSSVDPVELTLTPAKGLMVVTQDNKNGPAEAQLIKLTP